jgi:preprotein translocase subunit SecG
MNFVQSLVSVVHVLSALAVVILVLLQQGKGAEMGAAFGGGASSGSLFGATGSANFLSRFTAVCATIFLLCTLALAFQANPAGRAQSGGVMEKVNTQVPASSASGSRASGSVPSPAQPAQSGNASALPGTVPSQDIPK